MKAKYEVVDYVSGGYFIHGRDMLSENYFKLKEDADKVCQALNIEDRLKSNLRVRHIDTLIYDLELLKKELS